MSGLDKILEHISREAQTETDKILSEAKSAADQIIASGKREAQEMAASIHRQSELDVAAAVSRIESNAQMSEKRIILQAKQDKIEEIFEKAQASLENLNDEEYMDVIGKMIIRYASGEEGMILFNSRDLARLTEDVRKTAQEKNLRVSEKPADIRGGFILSYGDIEENCSFDTLIAASREELQDRIGNLLFGQQNL